MAEIIGLESLMRKLDRLGGNVLEALGKAINTTTVHAQSDARLYSPVDTGNLKDSISIEIEKKPDRVTGTVFTNVPYAIYQEMGTINMAAQPYMMPALNANRSRLETEAKSELNKEIMRAGV